MKAKEKKSPAFPTTAVQGFACPCEACRLEPEFSRAVFCARCGHAYIDLRTGRGIDDARMGCQKCGAKGQWADTRPTLPPLQPRRFRVRLKQTVIQTQDVEFSALTPESAIAQAMERVGGTFDTDNVEPAVVSSVTEIVTR